MCLAVPMQVEAVDGRSARCVAKGVVRQIDLALLDGEPVLRGDHVVVHLGFAVRKISPAEAAAAWELYDQILAADVGSPGPAAG